jgi:integrase
MLADGLDPSIQKRLAQIDAANKARITFRAIAEEYYQALEDRGLASATLRKKRRQIDVLAKPLHTRPIDQITAPELLHLLKTIEQSGRRETAKKLRATISAIFRLAMVTSRASADPSAALKDALAPMMHTTPELIEAQPKLSFAAHIRGASRQALPLKFPFGHLEDMARMDSEDWEELRQRMRDAYAVHFSELADVGVQAQKVRWKRQAGKRLGKTARHPHRTIRQQPTRSLRRGKSRTSRRQIPSSRSHAPRRPPRPRNHRPKGDIREWKLELRTPKKGQIEG